MKALSNFKWRWFLKAIALITSVFFVLFYIGLSPPVGEGIYNMVLFYPWKYPHGQYKPMLVRGVEAQDVWINKPDGKRLHGWFLPVPHSRYTVLLSHGNGGNLTLVRDSMEMLLDLHLSVFAYDYEGYGRSEGSPSLRRVSEDPLAAYNYLVTQRKIDPKSIIIFGESFGTAMSGTLANRDCAAIILQCPLASVRRRAVEICLLARLYPAFLWHQDGYDNIANFSRPHPSLLIIAGTADPMIPVAHADDLFKAAAQPKTFIRIDGAGHSHSATLTTSKEYSNGLAKFIAELPSPN